MSTETYRGYAGPNLPEAAIAKVELGAADWVRLNELRVERRRFGTVEVFPGEYRMEWGRRFGVSFLVDPRMSVKYQEGGTLRLEPGCTYRLGVDRTYGPGYKVYFWIEDATTGEVIYGTKKP